MATCIQEINWQLKKAVLQEMLHSAGDQYSAIQFKMCINSEGETKYYLDLVKVDLNAENVCEGVIIPLGVENEICPVPPDCNGDPELFKSVLEKYFVENKITFTIDKETLVAAFQ